MTVTVVLVGTLRRYSLPESPGEWSGQIPEGSRLRELARAIGIPEGLARSAAIDGTLANLDTPIPTGARVMFFSPVSGG